MKLSQFFQWHKFAIILCIICISTTIWIWAGPIHKSAAPSIKGENNSNNCFLLSNQTNGTFVIPGENGSWDNNLSNTSYGDLPHDNPPTSALPTLQEQEIQYNILFFIPPIVGGITLLYLISSAISFRPKKKKSQTVRKKAQIQQIQKKRDSREIIYQIKALEPEQINTFEQNKTTSQTKQPVIMAAKTTGQSHVRQGKPCQDTYSYSVHAPYVIIAIADGLGSASRSETGAHLAVETAIETIKTSFSESYTNGTTNLQELVKNGFLSARQVLIATAEKENYPIRDLATTLIIAISDGSTITTGQIGDGAVVALIDTTYTLVSSPQEQEYCNETIPLTSVHALDEIRISTNHGTIGEIAIFTDGCQRAALQRIGERYIPFEPFFSPLFSALKQTQSTETGEKMIEELLSSEKMTEISDDDKTLVIALF